MHKKIKGFIAAALTAVMCLGCFPGQTVKTQAAENLIINGNFEDADNLGVWNGAGHNGDAVVTAEVSETPIGDEKIMTYGKITGRGSNYNCFSYELTDKIEKNGIYKYSFYVMLDPEDYKDAPEEQRTVEISPHMRAGGKDTYSTGVGGTVREVLEPGVWTKFTGTFSISWGGDLELLALRFMEQGESWGSGPGVKGTYYLTGVQFYMEDAEPELIQTNIVDLKKAVNKKLGADGDFIVGTSIVNSDLADVETMALVTKHFNGLTLGNELKPDAMFGYAGSNPRTETVTFNGNELLVPVLDYSRAERTLDYVFKWNSMNPDKQIKVRGHVLLWHSQTPAWFFHENYDTSKPMVSKELMSQRLEWYIATMAEHFAGENSRYRDLFYAWDVVNEAVSDGTGTYRSDKENSKWWELYQSNEFIIQAFRFANKYMPEHIDLYYNDYNECGGKKSQGIAQLLRDVKAAEGTRIDGMGMQAHNKPLMSPSVTDFEKAVRLYAEVVDEIQITEWDVKVSSGYIATEMGKEQEYIRQAEYYHSFYEVIQKLRAEGINFGGMTFWGVIDPNSWLQSSSNVGGGADGTLEQLPLLFDGGYQAKPAFWAFADETRYQKLVNPEPTATPVPTEAPTATPAPTEAVEETETPEQAETVDPTEAPADDVATTGDAEESGFPMWIIAVVAVVLLCGGGAVILMKKKKEN